MTDREANEISAPANRFLNVSLQILVGIAVIGGLYLSSLYSYLLFHSIIEIFSIIVTSCIFLIAWNSRRFMDSNYMLFLGISFLFIAIIDILHTLTYKGMAVFPGYDANLPTQLWIIMRYMLAISFLVAPIFIRRKVNAPLVLFLYSAATVLLLLLIFYWGIFPACYVEGSGLTPFKIYSEYIISLILLGSLIYLILERKAFARPILGLLIGSIVLSIAAEMEFTTYASVYGFSNMLGHMLIFVSFYLIYKALIEISLTKPYDLMFRNLKNSEKKNRIILEQMYESYFEVDLAGNFTLVNESTCLNLGYPHEELIGKNYRLAVPGDDIKPLLLAFNEVYRTGVPNKGFEHKILRKDGSVITVESSISLLKNEQGDVIGFRSISQNITERKRAEEALYKEKEFIKSLVDTAQTSIVVLDTSGHIITINPYLEQISGYLLEEVKGKNWFSTFLPEAKQTKSRELFLNAIDDIQTKGNIDEIVTKDGRIRSIEWYDNTLKDANGDIVGLIAIGQDITERKQAEEALSSAEEKYRLLVENINDIFYILDRQGIFTYISPAVERVTRYKVSELIGTPIFPLIHPDDLPGLLDSFNHLVAGQLVPWEFRLLDKDGRSIFVRSSRQLLYKEGKAIGVTAVVTDITERKLMERKLEEMATHDFLTGLPNRVLLFDRFTIAAALAHRNKARLAVMSLDLDKFKTINDTLGHDAGDQVLKAVSKQLMETIRASDTLARIGGDEFILVMMETGDIKDTDATAQKILDAFKEPLSIGGHQLHLSTSIGIAIYPEDAEDLETLIKKSDAAMYYSKGHGRNQFKFFHDGDVWISGDHKSAA